uniref:Uncharacterized protein n=1 Tax=Sphaerodactylus townsendi TaxID=933632 RepID=A0ACB8F068_9SAUR
MLAEEDKNAEEKSPLDGRATSEGPILRGTTAVEISSGGSYNSEWTATCQGTRGQLLWLYPPENTVSH